jgi:predicted transcriptional regulator YdeE
MKKTTTSLSEIKLIGMKVRTNNKVEINDWQSGKIFPCIQQYFHQSVAEKIPNRKKPGTTFCAYLEYESDHTGDYTYFIGEEVNSFDKLPADLEKHIIAPQTYIKFTNGPGAMPNVVREPWFKIWAMSPEEIGGERAYIGDFEIYDERAADHQNVVLDIYIGIKK